MTDKPSKLWLSPFVFPSETNVRFLLLVIAAVMVAISVSRIIPSLLNLNTSGELALTVGLVIGIFALAAGIY